MVTHDEGKRETRAWMKDWQCASAIVGGQGRGLEKNVRKNQNTWRQVAVPEYGWVLEGKGERRRKIKTVMLLKEISH